MNVDSLCLKSETCLPYQILKKQSRQTNIGHLTYANLSKHKRVLVFLNNRFIFSHLSPSTVIVNKLCSYFHHPFTTLDL